MLRIIGIVILSFLSSEIICQTDPPSSRYSEKDIQLQHLYIQANQLKILNKYDDALELYKKILEDSDVNAAVHHDMARIYTALEDYDQAIASGKKAVRFSPENKWYKLSLISIYEQALFHKEAADLLNDLTSKVKQEDLYARYAQNLILDNQLEKAIEVFDEADEVFGWNQLRSDEKVDLYLKLGKESEATQELTKWVKKYPNQTKHLIKLARFYDFRADLGNAKKTYIKVLDIAPGNEEALTYINQTKKETSRSDISSYINNVNVGLDNKVLTLIPLIENADDEIMALCASLVQQYPDNAKSYALYGDALWLSGNVEGAIVQYNEAIKLNKSVYQVWDQLMMALTYSKDFEALKEVADEAMDFYPNQAGPYFYQAAAMMNNGNYDDALESNAEALFISEMSQSTIYSNSVLQKAQILLLKQDASGALEFLDQVPDEAKTSEILEAQGDIHLSLGDKASAVKNWQEALLKGGDRERIQSKIDSL